jgi:hypothetical protein
VLQCCCQQALAVVTSRNSCMQLNAHLMLSNHDPELCARLLKVSTCVEEEDAPRSPYPLAPVRPRCEAPPDAHPGICSCQNLWCYSCTQAWPNLKAAGAGRLVGASLFTSTCLGHMKHARSRVLGSKFSAWCSFNQSVCPEAAQCRSGPGHGRDVSVADGKHDLTAQCMSIDEGGKLSADR